MDDAGSHVALPLVGRHRIVVAEKKCGRDWAFLLADPFVDAALSPVRTAERDRDTLQEPGVKRTTPSAV